MDGDGARREREFVRDGKQLLEDSGAGSSRCDDRQRIAPTPVSSFRIPSVNWVYLAAG
jgi:hypothetical protein